MKTLLIRPGVEVLEKTLRGPWSPELSHLEKLYTQPGNIFRAIVEHATYSNSSSLAVGAVLKKLGEDVEFLDVPLEFGIPLTDELNTKRYEKIEQYIAKRNCDIVGISCVGSLDSLATQHITEAAKSISDDISVVIGGYQAVAEASSFMEKIPAIDVIVLSDFEPIAEQLYKSLNGEIPISNVPNVVFRENGLVRTSERKNLKVKPEDLPVFDYSLVEKYIPKYSLFGIEASRGCPYNCSFCQEKMFRKSYSVKDAPAVVDEIIENANYIGQFVDTVGFYFCDPLWGLNLKWVKTFCSQLIDRRDEIGPDKFGWAVEVRIGQFDAEALSLMKKAGCIAIGYGVESLSPKMLATMRKTSDPKKYITSFFETVENTLRENINAVPIFLFGLPGETHQTLEESLGHIMKLPLENEKLHLKIGLPVALSRTELDRQIHDPQLVEELGTRILDEYDWEKAYLPRLSQLYDPSRELSASEITDFICRTSNITAHFGKQIEKYENIRALVDKDEVSPHDLAEWSKDYRKILVAGLS
ncbi:MAG: B12-binding domain-containing radical SAM protein [Theionarchaea archaeon]|nr:B12-binding domain-containing radical SAM protein [Theionarchaea archaeon]